MALLLVKNYNSMEKRNEITDDIKDAISQLRGNQTIFPRIRRAYKLAESTEEAKELISSLAIELDTTINKFKWQPEYNLIAEWMVYPKKGLLMLGTPGRLKSIIATLIIPVLYKLRYKFNIRPIKAWQIDSELEKILSHPVVIVDDVGEEPPVNNFGIKHEPFMRLVDECERRSIILVLTTNLDSNGLISRYGERPVDRLDLLCTPVRFTGKSFR